ncbi:hypothetical protein GCM10020256_65790 [Streptomyces thermocoprophilus]
MSTTPPPQALPTDTRPARSAGAADDGAFGWLRALGPRGGRAFAGAFGGYALDAYDYFTLPLGMVALAAYFGLDSGRTGLFTTVTLVVSAVGGALAGSAGRPGRPGAGPDDHRDHLRRLHRRVRFCGRTASRSTSRPMCGRTGGTIW